MPLPLKQTLRVRSARFVRRILKKALPLVPGLHDIQSFKNTVSWNYDMNSRLMLKSIFSHFYVLYSTEISYVRLGDLADGGYILVNDLDEQDVVFSIGVGDNASFDFEIAKCVKEVILVDHTVSAPSEMTNNMVFYPKALSKTKSFQSTTIQRLLYLHPSKDYILKIDIEGAEWEILDSLDIYTLSLFRQIVLEFHDFSYPYFQDRFEMTCRVLEKLNLTHAPICFHPNNGGRFATIAGTPIPDVIEVTYIRKSDYQITQGESVQVEELTYANDPSKPEISDQWFKELFSVQYFKL
jgi:hypothetical protein